MMHHHLRECPPVSGLHSEISLVLKDYYNKHLITNRVFFKTHS